MLEKCVLAIPELNWNQRLGHKKTKLNNCHHMFMSSTQLQNRSNICFSCFIYLYQFVEIIIFIMCLFLHCVAVRCFPPKSSFSMHCTFSAQPCKMVSSNDMHCSNVEGKVLTMFSF